MPASQLAGPGAGPSPEAACCGLACGLALLNCRAAHGLTVRG